MSLWNNIILQVLIVALRWADWTLFFSISAFCNLCYHTNVNPPLPDYEKSSSLQNQVSRLTFHQGLIQNPPNSMEKLSLTSIGFGLGPHGRRQSSKFQSTLLRSWCLCLSLIGWFSLKQTAFPHQISYPCLEKTKILITTFITCYLG